MGFFKVSPAGGLASTAAGLASDFGGVATDYVELDGAWWRIVVDVDWTAEAAYDFAGSGAKAYGGATWSVISGTWDEVAIQGDSTGLKLDARAAATDMFGFLESAITISVDATDTLLYQCAWAATLGTASDVATLRFDDTSAGRSAFGMRNDSGTVKLLAQSDDSGGLSSEVTATVANATVISVLRHRGHDHGAYSTAAFSAFAAHSTYTAFPAGRNSEGALARADGAATGTGSASLADALRFRWNLFGATGLVTHTRVLQKV